MKSALFPVLILFFLGTTIFQTLRVNHWKHIVDRKTIECNRAITANENSFQKSSTDERAIELKVQNHLWLIYKLQEERLANHRSVISIPVEIQFMKNIQSELHGVRDETQELLTAKYALSHLSSDTY
jgi:hypothetical protein